MGKRRSDYRFKPSPAAVALVKSTSRGAANSRRARVGRVDGTPFLPPEDWYEPTDEGQQTPTYRVITQNPGPGYRHAVTAGEVRARLAQLPEWMLKPLEVVQLCRMTRKKQTFPCYGMQWGSVLYLYPLEAELVEEFDRPPRPAVFNEARMYGGRWRQLSGSRWQLEWTPETLRDFYLNNVLIHELGHLLDDRNTSYTDRERFAEWFAIENGYHASDRPAVARKAAKRIRKRHHAS